MTIPTAVVSTQEWISKREALLVREKELTRARDALAAERRRLPMVRVERDYRFEGPAGEVGLLDLFDVPEYLGVNVFLRDGDQIYRSFFANGRAARYSPDELAGGAT